MYAIVASLETYIAIVSDSTGWARYFKEGLDHQGNPELRMFCQVRFGHHAGTSCPPSARVSARAAGQVNDKQGLMMLVALSAKDAHSDKKDKKKRDAHKDSTPIEAKP
jgi:hypothetical protein